MLAKQDSGHPRPALAASCFVLLWDLDILPPLTHCVFSVDVCCKQKLENLLRICIATSVLTYKRDVCSTEGSVRLGEAAALSGGYRSERDPGGERMVAARRIGRTMTANVD